MFLRPLKSELKDPGLENMPFRQERSRSWHVTSGLAWGPGKIADRSSFTRAGRSNKYLGRWSTTYLGISDAPKAGETGDEIPSIAYAVHRQDQTYKHTNLSDSVEQPLNVLRAVTTCQIRPNHFCAHLSMLTKPLEHLDRIASLGVGRPIERNEAETANFWAAGQFHHARTGCRKRRVEHYR